MRSFTKLLLPCVAAVSLTVPAAAVSRHGGEAGQKQQEGNKDGARKSPAAGKGSQRLENVRSRMKARDKEIDRIMNKAKKR